MVKSKKSGRKKAGVPPEELYEADDYEMVPDEEKHAGQRYDVVDNYEYELPSDFEDEEIDEETAFNEEDEKLYADWFGEKDNGRTAKGRATSPDLLESKESDDGSEEYNTDDFSEPEEAEHGAAPESIPEGSEDALSEDDDEEEQEQTDDEEQHERMLADVSAAIASSGPRAAARRRGSTLLNEVYPESEYNLQPAVASAGDAGGELRISDLMDALGADRAKLPGDARKKLERLDKRLQPVAAPLPTTIRARKQRQAGYEETTKDVTKWQSIVKANREAPTLKFATGREDVQRTSTTAALTAKFAPARDFEREIASMLEAAGAHNEQAVQEAEEALALKAQSVEEAKARRDRLAKMRSLLFHQEMKLKHLAKIKSKDYHRRAQRAAKAKAKKAGEMGDNEQLRLAAEDAEFNRAKERLTLKHRNTSKWARRALKRGINVTDEGTQEAIAEQLRLGQELRRKVERPESESSEDESGSSASEASDGEEAGQADANGRPHSRRAAAKLKAAALDIINGGGEEGEEPAKGLFALPFMRRAQERRRAQAQADAAAMLRELEAADARTGGGSDEDADDWTAPQSAERSGRLRFGSSRQQPQDEEADEHGSDADFSDEDEDAEAKAERLGSRLAPDQDKQPSTSGRQAAEARVRAAATERQAAKAPSKGKGSKGGPTEADQGEDGRLCATDGPVAVSGSGLISKQAMGATRRSKRQQEQRGWDGSKRAPVVADGEGRGVLAAVAQQQRELLLNLQSSAKPNGTPVKSQSKSRWSVGPLSAEDAVADAKESALAAANSPAEFVPEKKFKGQRDGYFFQDGPQGVGYYLDRSSKPASSKGGETSEQAIDTGADGNGRLADEEDDGGMQPVRGGKELSQRELIARAFAGDDVQAEFAEEKAREAEAEAPPADAPSLLPGWGAWAGQQRTPGWMAKAQDKALRNREATIAKRKDAKLAAVIITERYDKKAAKYATPAVPFPFNSKDIYERSIRQPLGRDFNTDSSFRDMTRPKILKTPGVVIAPLKYSKGVEKEAASQPSNNAKRKSIAVVSNGRRKQSKR
ncbi:probable U3 small nucleolar RNA-associated protein 14 homolog A [Coccomyxa sp. Obi]|nr:probable U3 small nucleolar RNA-associated protein 14 homolog A [Coccomyxa sp. Obi]